MPLTPIQQHFTKFYLSAFLRAPDLGGLNYWNDEVLVHGKSLQQVGGIIFSLSVVTAIYPANLSDQEFVESIYRNVFGRDSDAEGLGYWSNEIASLRNSFTVQGSTSAAFEARGQLVMNMINAGLGTLEGTPGKAYIENRLDVATYAAEKQLAVGRDIQVSQLLDIMNKVDEFDSTVYTATQAIDNAFLLAVPISLGDIANGSGGFVVNGQAASDYSGHSLSSAGDVNGDGLADIIIGAYPASPDGKANAGKSYVVFGKASGNAVNLSEVSGGNGGFVINGQTKYDFSGFSVSNAGDVNGDGLADLIVGARYADTLGGTSAGKSYVVFGKADGAAVELGAVDIGVGGFVINGEGNNDLSGSSVSAAGDVNGDGLADLIVGARNADTGLGADVGKSYVVFGKFDGSAVNLSEVTSGNGGFVINGQSAYDGSGFSVSSAGDVNGDGLSDLIVAAPDALGGIGKSYVVFGKTNVQPVNLDALENSTAGFVIKGLKGGDRTAWSVSAAGDVNGDGLADLIIGAPHAELFGYSEAGISYVVFGKSNGTRVNLIDVISGKGGFVISGQGLGNNSGWSVSAAGDMNGDGLADLLIGAPEALGSELGAAGKSYVVYGKATGHSVDLNAVANDGKLGFEIKGQAGGSSGRSISPAGDVNGDGLADLLVGAYEANGSSGKSYVIFGGTTGAFAQTKVDQMGETGFDTLSDSGMAQTLVGNSGDDVLTARAASVLYGGADDDVFVIDGAMITALASNFGTGGNYDRLARIDGGSGLDTIALSGAGLNLNLKQVANQGFDTIGFSRIESVERIDLTGTGNNTLTLSFRDVMSMSQSNAFDSYYAGAYHHQLRIEGNYGDVLDLADGADTSGWFYATTVDMMSDFYNVWLSNNGLAALYVSTELFVI